MVGIIDLIITSALILLAIFVGYRVSGEERLKLERRCLELSRNAKKMQDEYDDKIKQRDKLINNQVDKLTMKDKCMKEIIRNAKLYEPMDKIIELAETGIKA